MYKYGLLLLGTTCIILGLGSAADIPYIFDQSTSSIADYTPAQLESMRAASPELSGVPSVSTPKDDEVLMFPVTGGGSAPGSTTEKKVGDLKKTFDSRVEPDNSRVHEEATVLALKYPGDLTIDQIDSIYNYLKNGDGTKKGWGYVRDPRGIDYFNYANASLKLGDKANCVGGGDCDDFAILMSALVESIGGTTRIILAHNNTTGGHAYTEVYIGRLDSQNSQVNEIMDWLKQKYNSDKIFTHIVTDTKDVWLNLDWGPDEKGNAHPGGPFYQGDKHIVICIRDTYQKTPLKMPASYIETPLRLPESYQEQIKQRSNAMPAEIPQILENRITNVRFTPATPANLVFGEPVKVSFDYQKNQTGYVLIYADFMIGGRIVGAPFDPFTDGSPHYNNAMGSGNFNLSIDSNKIVTIGEVKIYMNDKDHKTICEITTPVQFHYGPDGINKELQSLCAKGNLFFIQNDYDNAIKFFDQVIQISPDFKYAWKDRGDAFSSNGNYEEAIKSYDEALRIEPRFAEAWRDKGEALVLAGKYDEAVKCFDEAIKCYSEGKVYNDGMVESAREGKTKALNALGRNFITQTLDVIDTGSVTLYGSASSSPQGNITISNQCSYNFFANQDHSAKTYGDVAYGDFYFGENKFYANNAGMHGLVDLGPVEFNLNNIKIPIEGFYKFGVEAITGHVYVSPARWCSSWEGDKYKESDCGQNGSYVIFTVKGVQPEAETVDIDYVLVKVRE